MQFGGVFNNHGHSAAPIDFCSLLLDDAASLQHCVGVMVGAAAAKNTVRGYSPNYRCHSNNDVTFYVKTRLFYN